MKRRDLVVDVLALGGTAMIGAGLWLITPALVLIAAGCACVYLAVVMA